MVGSSYALTTTLTKEGKIRLGVHGIYNKITITTIACRIK